MGKLMYTNRKSEGVKLGQIVAKDLRKKNKPSTISKGDPNKDMSLLELQLDGKNLTDDGLAEVARGFEDVLTSTNGVFYTKLQILNISGNDLTVQALAELSKSLRAASNDLEELDLSANRISIATPKDAIQWESFLMALEDCNKLRRLSLEGNDLGGSLPFEILARVYSLQCQRNAAARWHAPSFEIVSDGNTTVNDKLRSLSLDFNRTDSPLGFGDRGLPSITNIILTNTSMTDHGALFLSYVLEHHAGAPDMDEAECGIDFLSNDRRGSVGTKILRHASNMPEDTTDPTPVPSENGHRPDIPSVIPSSRRSSHSPHHRRKPGCAANASEDSPKTPLHQSQITGEEYESLRKKVQRAIIEDKGAHSVELWGTSLKLLSYARILVDDDMSQRSRNRAPFTDTPPRRNRSSSGSHLTPFSTPQPTYAPKLVLNTNLNKEFPALPSHASSRGPFTPQVVFKPASAHRKSPSSDHNSPGWSIKTDYSSRSSAQTSSVDVTPYMSKPDPPRFVGRLPENVWVQIFTCLTDARGLLTEEQRGRIVAIAKDRATLAIEAEAMGKPDSVQIWRVLDAMGSLAYDVGV